MEIDIKGKGKEKVENVDLKEGRNTFIEENLRNLPQDHSMFLERIRERLDRVGLNLPGVEVRFQNLHVEADCEVVHGKPLPTLFNAFTGSIYGIARGLLKILGFKFKEAKVTILRDVSGIIKPSRMTLLLGPPGCGKTTLLRALSGRLDHSLQVEGDVSYNGFKLEDFIPQKTSAYVSQHDLHIPELTVRETLDFSARCQGSGRRADLLVELEKREKEAGIVPDSDLDAYMKAISIGGAERTPETDYILKVLGLETCSDVIIGDAMKRGISGGEKKRLTLGEMIIGPSRAFFMDEISNGLDSSTAYQIIAVLQRSVHIMETSMLVSLLQPAPEIYNLFDEIILMAEGKIIYHGLRVCVSEFFESCGFRCPERKSPADFLQEVISRKDQAQYWCFSYQPYDYVSIEQFQEKFIAYSSGQKLSEELSQPLFMLKGNKDALSFSAYSISKRELLKACISRELLLASRNPFVYVLKLMQLMLIAFIAMTAFIRTQMSVDLVHANYYMGALFFSLLLMVVNSNPEMMMTLSRLAIFYKQRDSYFYPAWAFSLPSLFLKIPHSLVASLVFTSFTYYVIGYSPEATRFFCQFLLFFVVHLMFGSLIRAIVAVCRSAMAVIVAHYHLLLALLTFGGFILPLPSIPSWIKWGFWFFPLSYAEIGVVVTEFHAPRWKQISSGDVSIGENVMRRKGLLYQDYFYWICIGALIGFTVIFNIVFTLALTYLRAPSNRRTVISLKRFSQLQKGDDCSRDKLHKTSSSSVSIPISSMEQKRGKMILPFEPLTLCFKGVQYFVESPSKMRNQGVTHKTIQLLRDVTGVFRPQVLTALMGVSGAGKTTLLDVLSGRKTSGVIEGDIYVGGYTKVQETFSRISGYCEQNDIHSPYITVEESVIHSAWLRLGPLINQNTKMEFVNEVLETIELDEIKDTLVGIPGISGLSLEQRKRLTLAVELVANPSILFIDEPTTGLDARTAAIVMRAVRNVVETGRTVVCTIHQPSIDIFESFDELILIKKGGRIIYSGQLGWHSKNVINYFESVPGIPKIKDNHNPAIWMLEVTSTSMETQLGFDFAQIYKDSCLCQETEVLVEQLSKPPPGSKKLHFATRFAVNSCGQFTACLWKCCLSYWRSPDYNLKRILSCFFTAVFFSLLFWKHARILNTEQDLLNVAGFMFMSISFLGIGNCHSVQKFVEKERLVMCRERFLGMYSSIAYSLAQIAIEIPYIFVQAFIYASITYPAIGFQLSAYKFLWYLGAIFFSLLQYTYFGMFLISVSSSTEVSTIYSSTFHSTANLFAGFLIPRPRIPVWWVWFYWISPTSWTFNAILTSQYGDIDREIEAFGEHKGVNVFIKEYFGFQHDRLPLVAAMLVALPLLYATLFAIAMAKLNFQKR
ncbi:pleiotropic drug resistance protein 3-like protein isoform X1 [Cinnamomum micranthum f. kanehirae]|uniref:Pleiotropic drug resistance protein 3-like protein isoform X1 n=1 Tax=Cinnamomum micranthum f. kanehirae TaxID=337451 RepID=A0A3S3PRY7_9MAGN|nr:pleiotropic drug resistance protein 3-like protein isoform X1 [Cinnamomum micranthum f. kanehirae]